MDVHHIVPGVLSGQKRALDALEVELQKVMSHRVDTGKPTWVHERQELLTTESSRQPLNL